MDIKKAIGQLFVVGFQGKTMSEEVKRQIREYHVGGVILFSQNIGSPEEVLALTNALQKEAKEAGYERPLLIAADEENGTVKRLREGAGNYPGGMALSAIQDTDYAYEIGKATGDDLRLLGINWNYAPVLDVNINPKNPVIGVRSFGEDPERVSEVGLASMKGLQDGGVATSTKHFPGHGDTNVDSHYALPVISHDVERIHEVELVPFKAAIAEGTDSIMTTHIVFPALEPDPDRPATLSKNILTGLLREELGYDGVIVTDALEMKAIADTFGIANGAVEAINAGADSLIIGHLADEQFKSLERVEEAVNNGEIEMSRITDSIERISKLKDKYTSWDDLDLNNTTVPAMFNSEEKQALTIAAYEKSVTVLREGQPLERDMSILLLQPKDERSTIAEDITNENYIIENILKQYVDKIDVELISSDLPEEQYKRILEKAGNFDRIIVGAMVASEESRLVQLVNELTAEYVVDYIGIKSPYIGQWLNNTNFWINTYEPSSIPVDIAIKALLGDIKPTGVSPVTLKV